MLDVIEALTPLLAKIERRDRDLGDQLRRAATSVVLNLAEAEGVSGGNRAQRRRTALGSLYEVRGAIDVAVRFGYVHQREAAAAAELAHRVGGMIYRLVQRA